MNIDQIMRSAPVIPVLVLEEKLDLLLSESELSALPELQRQFIERYGYRHMTKPGLFVLEFDNGDLTYDVMQVIPDEKNLGDVQLRFSTRFAPNGQEFSFGPFTVRSDGFTDARFSGRQIVMRIEPIQDTDWRVGRYRLDATAGSPR